MSQRNVVPRPADKKRPQLFWREKFWLPENHEDYVEREKAFQKEDNALRSRIFQLVIKLSQLKKENKRLREKLRRQVRWLDNHRQRREEAKEVKLQLSRTEIPPTSNDIPAIIKRKTERSYKELEARKTRVRQLEKIYKDMSMKKELQKNGRKRKLCEDEIINPTDRPVYKWHMERKR